MRVKLGAQYLAVVVIGLFSGAMLIIGASLLPYWMTLSTDLYRDSFKAIGPHLGRIMIPLMVSSIGLAGVSIFTAVNSRRVWILVFFLLFAIIPLYGFVHGPVNDALLGNEALSSGQVIELRTKWIFLHCVRTAFGCGAFLLSLAVYPGVVCSRVN